MCSMTTTYEHSSGSEENRDVIYQQKPGADYTASTITIENNPLNITDKITYLGSTISQNAMINDDISARIGKTNGSFGKLTKERRRSAAGYSAAHTMASHITSSVRNFVGPDTL